MPAFPRSGSAVGVLLQQERNMRVLIVDDERSVAETLLMILQGEGYEAASAYNGSAALQKIEFFTPDCVISDVIMPGKMVSQHTWLVRAPILPAAKLQRRHCAKARNSSGHLLTLCHNWCGWRIPTAGSSGTTSGGTSTREPRLSRWKVGGGSLSMIRRCCRPCCNDGNHLLLRGSPLK